jgi:uncharacterized NAD-dependent epimerase/dehydratase family protein
MSNSKKPGTKWFGQIKSCQSIEALDERIERDVFSIVIIADHAVDITEDSPFIEIENSLTRGLIVVQGFLDKLL